MSNRTGLQAAVEAGDLLVPLAAQLGKVWDERNTTHDAVIAAQQAGNEARAKRLGCRDDHLSGLADHLETAIANIPASSLAGAAIQLCYASDQMDAMQSHFASNRAGAPTDPAEIAADRDISDALAKIRFLIDSAWRAVERAASVSAERMGMADYIYPAAREQTEQTEAA